MASDRPPVVVVFGGSLADGTHYDAGGPDRDGAPGAADVSNPEAGAHQRIWLVAAGATGSS